MLDRILIPLDGSEYAEAILPTLFTFGDGEIERSLVHVLPAGASGLDAAAGVMIEPAQVMEYFSDVRRRFPDLIGRTIIQRGDPTDGILSAAVDFRANLIAMTTHGRSGLRRVLLGSVAEGVVRRSHLPVLILRERVRLRSGNMGRILLPVGSTGGPESLFAGVEEFAQKSGAEVTLFHVDTEGKKAGGDIHQATTWTIRLAELAQSLARRGIRVTTRISKGDPATEILAEAERSGADLIAMATRGLEGMARLKGGSVAEDVLRRAECLVLLDHLQSGDARDAGGD